MNQQPHSERSHSVWSASASARRWACSGSLAMEMAADTPDKESQAAAWGTACHEISERALRSGADCLAYLGETVKTKEHEIEVDDEVCETGQVYVDYVRKAAKGATLVIEQNFSLESLGTPFPAGGTSDAVILNAETGVIEIVDLKGGRGIVVEAEGNKQLRTYALGALLANPGPWTTVKATIVQPRAPHQDGRIRSETFSVAELMDWTAELLEAMAKAKTAMARKATTGLNPWGAVYLTAGDHCQFCKAAGACPALQARALKDAHTYFDDESGAVKTPPAPESLDTAQIVRILDAADMIGNWLNSVRARAQHLVELGEEVADGDAAYVLAPKRATRKWTEEATPETLSRMVPGREPEDFYLEPKPMSPAQVEKLLGKKGFAAVEGFVTKESSGFNLVRADKTTRAAIASHVQQFFQPE